MAGVGIALSVIQRMETFETLFFIEIADGEFGLIEWSKGMSTVYIYREVVTLPLGTSAVFFIQLAALVLLACVYFRFCRFRDAAEPGFSSERAETP